MRRRGHGLLARPLAANALPCERAKARAAAGELPRSSSAAGRRALRKAAKARRSKQLPPGARIKKRRDARRRKDKAARSTDVPSESTREKNLRLLQASSKPNGQLEDLLAQLTGEGGGDAKAGESDFDDLDF
eukprot:jgi/Tetstr1/449194/TSEL_036401.t1